MDYRYGPALRDRVAGIWRNSRRVPMPQPAKRAAVAITLVAGAAGEPLCLIAAAAPEQTRRSMGVAEHRVDAGQAAIAGALRELAKRSNSIWTPAPCWGCWTTVRRAM